MSQTEPEGILQQIDQRLAALTSAEKHLKHPSTISFAERRDLTAKASRAAAELRARRGELEESEASSETEAPEPARAALEEADRVLGLIGGAGSGGSARRSAGAARNLPGQNRRGAGGLNSQQRLPDRSGE